MGSATQPNPNPVILKMMLTRRRGNSVHGKADFDMKFACFVYYLYRMGVFVHTYIYETIGLYIWPHIGYGSFYNIMQIRYNATLFDSHEQCWLSTLVKMS